MDKKLQKRQVELDMLGWKVVCVSSGEMVPSTKEGCTVAVATEADGKGRGFRKRDCRGSKNLQKRSLTRWSGAER